MALKSRSAKKPSDAQVAALADKLADKQYSGASPVVSVEKTVHRSFAMPESLDLAITRVSAENKLSGSGPTNTSAVIREALDEYLERRK